VRFALNHDRQGQIRFAPLGGSTFERLIPEEMRGSLPDSLVVLTDQGECLIRSKGVIHLLCRMDPPWPGIGAVLAWIPPILLDGMYRLIARLRPTKPICSMDDSVSVGRFDP
jgi:predicted DCC family thiol-disulfide oxidoreductase YuxK